jgi:hypothetical protein
MKSAIFTWTWAYPMLAAVGLFLSAAGCREFDPAEYLAVCSDGRAVAQAPPHDPQKAPDPDVPIFTALKDQGVKRWLWNQDLLTKSLREAGLTPTTRKNYERAALVLCVEQMEEVLARECYVEDVTLQLYNGRYTATLREAKTGRVLETRTFEARNYKCPRNARVSLSETSPKRYPPPVAYQSELRALLGPHLPPPVRGRLLSPPPPPPQQPQQPKQP